MHREVLGAGLHMQEDPDAGCTCRGAQGKSLVLVSMCIPVQGNPGMHVNLYTRKSLVLVSMCISVQGNPWCCYPCASLYREIPGAGVRVHPSTGKSLVLVRTCIPAREVCSAGVHGKVFGTRVFVQGCTGRCLVMGYTCRRGA